MFQAKRLRRGGAHPGGADVENYSK